MTFLPVCVVTEIWFSLPFPNEERISPLSGGIAQGLRVRESTTMPTAERVEENLRVLLRVILALLCYIYSTVHLHNNVHRDFLAPLRKASAHT